MINGTSDSNNALFLSRPKFKLYHKAELPATLYYKLNTAKSTLPATPDQLGIETTKQSIYSYIFKLVKLYMYVTNCTNDRVNTM